MFCRRGLGCAGLLETIEADKEDGHGGQRVHLLRDRFLLDPSKGWLKFVKAYRRENACLTIADWYEHGWLIKFTANLRGPTIQSKNQGLTRRDLQVPIS